MTSFQAGPIDEVRIPEDRETKKKKSFGFVHFRHKTAVEYAVNIFRGTRLCGRDLNIQNRTGDAPNGAPQQGLERLSGYQRQNSSNNRDMMPTRPPPPMMMNPMMSAMNPALFAMMGDQMLNSLKAANPFAANVMPSDSGYGGPMNHNNGGRGGGSGGGFRPDRNNWNRNNHSAKPYDRPNERRRSRSRDRKNRSRSRDRNRRRR